MCPEMAKVVGTPTIRKCKAPRPARGKQFQPGATAAGSILDSGRSPGFEGEQSDAAFDAGEPVECPVPAGELFHAAPEAVDPLLLPYPSHGVAPGAVAAEAAVQLRAPMASVGC